MKDIIARFVIPIVLIVGGILFVCIGVNQTKNVDTFKEVNATITNIDVEYGVGEETNQYTVLVKYTVNGKEYEEEIDNYKSSYSVGDEITVKYNPQKPEEITAMSKGGLIVYIAVGVVAALAGAVLLIRVFMGKSIGKVTTRTGPVEDYDLKM